MTIDPESLIRPLLRELQSYVPGEQPKVKGLVKLNTNENPYPPAPKVLRAIRTAADQRLRLYPNPTAERLREKLGKFHRCGPENIIVGNGSDELQVLVVRTFSKAYCLCFLRVGYLVGHPKLISALHKIRDSYNVNGLGQIAAETTLDELNYYRRNFKRVKATRKRLGAALSQLGFL